MSGWSPKSVLGESSSPAVGDGDSPSTGEVRGGASSAVTVRRPDHTGPGAEPSTLRQERLGVAGASSPLERPRHLHLVAPIPADKPSELLREFISAHVALMVSVPDSERKSLAAKARRFGDSYSALMREMRP